MNRKKIVETLEKDESFLNANKVKVFSSITAVDFYKKLGYHYKKEFLKPTNRA